MNAMRAKYVEEKSYVYAINYIQLFYKFYNLSTLDKIFILQGT